MRGEGKLRVSGVSESHVLQTLYEILGSRRYDPKGGRGVESTKKEGWGVNLVRDEK